MAFLDRRLSFARSARRGTTICLVALCAALFEVASANAEDPRLQRVIAEQYAKDQGLSVAEAVRRLDAQDKAGRHIDRIPRIIGEARYGGSWFGGDPYGLRIAVVGGDAALTDAQRTEIGRLLDAPYRYVDVTSSVAQLRAEQDRLAERLRGLMDARKVLTGQELDRNRILVRKAGNLPESQDKEIADAATASRVRVHVESVARSQVGPKPQRCSGTSAGLVYCDRPLHGGVAIHNAVTGSGLGCGAAFNARRDSDGEYVVLTAGHCPALLGGASYPWYTGTITGGTSYHYLGPVLGVRYGPDDVGMISTRGINSPYWLGPPPPAPYVVVDLPTYRNDNYPIRQEAWSSVGRTVCITSGARRLSSGHYSACGTVTNVNLSFTYSDGVRMDGMTEVYVCAGIGPGSSGSPWMKDEAAFGIHSGGTDDGCFHYYQEAVEAEQIAHAQIVHP